MDKSIKEEIFSALRGKDLNTAISVITTHQADLDEEAKNHIIRLLDLKLDSGQSNFVCEIASIIWPNGITKISPSVRVCNNVPETVNIKSKLMLYSFASVAKKFASHNLPEELIANVFSYLDIKNLSITEKSFKEMLNVYQAPKKFLELKQAH